MAKMTPASKEAPVLSGSLVGVAIFCGVVNMLAFAGPLFMLEIDDRVLPARHLATFVTLLGLVIGLFAFSGFFDISRGRVMTRFAAAIDFRLLTRVFAGAPLGDRTVISYPAKPFLDHTPTGCFEKIDIPNT